MLGLRTVVPALLLYLGALSACGGAEGTDGPANDGGPSPQEPDSSTSSSCSQPCDLFAQCGCGANQACSLDPLDDDKAACRSVSGDGRSGDSCSVDEECAAGYGCFGNPGLCRKYCMRDDQCTDGGKCVIEVGSTATKTCSTPCKPEAESGSGCPSGTACDLFEADDGDWYTECRGLGLGGEGDDCTSPSDCKAGHTCYAFSESFQICTHTCVFIDGPLEQRECDDGNLCRAYADEIVIAGTEYGGCAP